MPVLSFFEYRRRRRAIALYEAGQEAIRDRKYEQALANARKLRKVRHTGAFELEALAYSGLGQKEVAIRVLREGLNLGPSAWPNWQLLGSYLSDLAQYEEALEAYDHAEECPEANRPSIVFNRAIVHTRLGQDDVALRLLDEVITDDETLRLRVDGCRLGCLWRTGREREAEALGQTVLRGWQAETHEDGEEEIGRIALTLGELRRSRGDDPAVLRAAAIEDWRSTRHPGLLWLIRDLRPDRSAVARHFHILVRGSRLSDASRGTRGFYASAEVVADSPEEALAYLNELEPPEAGLILAIDESRPLEPCPDQPRGVYRLQGRVYYHETE